MTARPAREGRYTIGIVSDTHGMLPAAALEAFRGSDAIVHAGDVMDGSDLDALAAIAPVILVRGNNRYPAEAGRPRIVDVVLGGVRMLVAHRGEDLPAVFAPGPPVRLIVVGHTHVGLIEESEGVVWVNPGSPSLPRKGAIPSVALVEIGADGSIAARLVPIV